jgi:hypothetical protein
MVTVFQENDSYQYFLIIQPFHKTRYKHVTIMIKNLFTMIIFNIKYDLVEI